MGRGEAGVLAAHSVAVQERYVVQWLCVRQPSRSAQHVQRTSAVGDSGLSGAIDHTSGRMSRVHKPLPG